MRPTHLLIYTFILQVFWYDDARTDPLTWHKEFLASVGVHLPIEVVETATRAAVQLDFAFPIKQIDVHPGGDNSVNRTYVDEISAETLSSFDDILRTWLPPVLLARLGVSLT